MYLYAYRGFESHPLPNPGQEDGDGDGLGDACDFCPLDAPDDTDGDGVCDSDDTCPGSDDNADSDGDGVADGCDACPGFDDSEDFDSDGVIDACDLCENSGTQNFTVKPKIQLKKINSDVVPGNDGLKIQGEFTIGTSFAALDPIATGAQVVVTASDGTTLIDISIPPTTGWSANNSGTKFSFKDKAKPGVNNGISKIQIQDRSKKAPGQVKIKVQGKNGNYPVTLGDEPLRATVLIGVNPGECADSAFVETDCGFNGKGNGLKCQQ